VRGREFDERVVLGLVSTGDASFSSRDGSQTLVKSLEIKHAKRGILKWAMNRAEP